MLYLGTSLGLFKTANALNTNPNLVEWKRIYPRGLDANELAQLAHENNLQGKAYSSVKSAFNAARKAAAKNDLVFVGGSTFVVAEVV